MTLLSFPVRHQPESLHLGGLHGCWSSSCGGAQPSSKEGHRPSGVQPRTQLCTSFCTEDSKDTGDTGKGELGMGPTSLHVSCAWDSA